MKTCGKCKIEKSAQEFYTHKNHTDGLSSYCIDCTKASTAEWYAANKDKAADTQWAGHIRRRYGITAEQYQELLEKQNHCCTVCLKHQDSFKFRLAVDHNHKTGAVRGLLCINCNHRLVGRHVDGAMLRRMADYVESETGWFVPENMRSPKKRRPRKPRKVKNG